ncbi:MAG: blue light receptor [Trizodia sp. TS-e1964]|nr:MAG: blue light receptor [Trizodia sp. TS-e1964]
MSSFDSGTVGAENQQAGLNMGSHAPADSSMTGMLDQEGDLLSALDMDLLPMNLDVNIGQGGDSRLYSSDQQLQDDSNNDTTMGNTMTGVGAGPLPTSYGINNLHGGSTLTEFTKRRNWSQRVIEELKDFLHILTPEGQIVWVSRSSLTLTGYHEDELVGKYFSTFIHPDDSGIWVREFNESIASGHPLRFFYRFRRADFSYTIFESHGHPHLDSQAAAFGPSANSLKFCRGVFIMARPYPTKNAALLDSFLEHKIENERLTAKIKALKLEALDDAENAQRRHESVTPSVSQPTDSETMTSTAATPAAAPPNENSYDGMPPPATPTISNTALTRRNLDEANQATKPDTIVDKMARYEGATHIETIEMLTGLRYREGERSVGISTGDINSSLIRGDGGAAAADKDLKGLDKKKKTKVADEYVCTDCGTLDSPEWRKGPNGPKTLCNACGLRWAKKEKKRTESHGPPPTVIGVRAGSS